MAAQSTTPDNRTKLELYCLLTALIPMPDESHILAKAVALIFVSTWAVLTVLLALEPIPTVSPPFYGLFTAVVFLLIGRLWNLEVDKLLPGNSNN